MMDHRFVATSVRSWGWVESLWWNECFNHLYSLMDLLSISNREWGFSLQFYEVTHTGNHPPKGISQIWIQVREESVKKRLRILCFSNLLSKIYGTFRGFLFYFFLFFLGGGFKHQNLATLVHLLTKFLRMSHTPDISH